MVYGNINGYLGFKVNTIWINWIHIGLKWIKFTLLLSS